MRLMSHRSNRTCTRRRFPIASTVRPLRGSRSPQVWRLRFLHRNAGSSLRASSLHQRTARTATLGLPVTFALARTSSALGRPTRPRLRHACILASVEWQRGCRWWCIGRWSTEAVGCDGSGTEGDGRGGAVGRRHGGGVSGGVDGCVDGGFGRLRLKRRAHRQMRQRDW